MPAPSEAVQGGAKKLSVFPTGAPPLILQRAPSYFANASLLFFRGAPLFFQGVPLISPLIFFRLTSYFSSAHLLFCRGARRTLAPQSAP